MNRLIVLNSNSDGNTLILDVGDECLILDAGIDPKEVKIALDFNIRKISGVVSSHQHSDHSKYLKQYEKMGIPITAPFQNDLVCIRRNSHFKIQPFALTNKDGQFVHTNGDGSECPCYGFYIKHPNLGTLIYATDTEFIKYRFNKINHILIESNYDTDSVDEESDNATHIFRGHMSIQTACDFLKANNSDRLENVVLCHLSKVNGNPQMFKTMAEQVVNCHVYIAEKNTIINL